MEIYNCTTYEISFNIIKSYVIRWARRVACIRADKYSSLVENPEFKKLLLRRRGFILTEADLKKCGGGVSTGLIWRRSD